VVNAARFRKHLAWEELFARLDQDKSGSLDWLELKRRIRLELSVPHPALSDPELQALFEEMDKDGNGMIDLAEMFAYLQHGHRSPEEKASRAPKRVQRVRKNIQVGFSKVSSQEADVRRLFRSIDQDSDKRLSMWEFQGFVRQGLRLNRWDIPNHDLEEFYYSLAPNGDGIDTNEFLQYVQSKDKGPNKLGAQNLYIKPEVAKAMKRRSFRDLLAEEQPQFGRRQCLSSSLPDLRRSGAFTNLGRTRPPAYRVS
jgi:Ca2+-binding EF-hand superfamily protein